MTAVTTRWIPNARLPVPKGASFRGLSAAHRRPKRAKPAVVRDDPSSVARFEVHALSLVLADEEDDRLLVLQHQILAPVSRLDRRDLRLQARDLSLVDRAVLVLFLDRVAQSLDLLNVLADGLVLHLHLAQQCRAGRARPFRLAQQRIDLRAKPGVAPVARVRPP